MYAALRRIRELPRSVQLMLLSGRVVSAKIVLPLQQQIKVERAHLENSEETSCHCWHLDGTKIPGSPHEWGKSSRGPRGRLRGDNKEVYASLPDSEVRIILPFRHLRTTDVEVMQKLISLKCNRQGFWDIFLIDILYPSVEIIMYNNNRNSLQSSALR